MATSALRLGIKTWNDYSNGEGVTISTTTNFSAATLNASDTCVYGDTCTADVAFVAQYNVSSGTMPLLLFNNYYNGKQRYQLR